MIAEQLEAQGHKIDRDNIQTEPIKATGSFKVPVKLHRDVIAQVRVVVTAEQGDEAKPEAQPTSSQASQSA